MIDGLVHAQWPKRGARSKREVDPEFLDYLEAGVVESRTHVEQMAMSMSRLLRNAFPNIDRSELDDTPFIARLREIGRRIQAADPTSTRRVDHSWVSDTVRGWLAMATAEAYQTDISAMVEALRPFATDHHFAVREWAWLAARPYVAANIEGALVSLEGYFASIDPLERRFAIELTRPRSVWGQHIQALVATPEMAEVGLSLLRCESHPYPRAALRNWLRDARRSRPDWVRHIVDAWSTECSCRHTKRILLGLESGWGR